MSDVEGVTEIFSGGVQVFGAAMGNASELRCSKAIISFSRR